MNEFFAVIFLFIRYRRSYLNVTDVKLLRWSAIFFHIPGVARREDSISARGRSDDVKKAAFYEWKRSLRDQSAGKDD